MASYRGIKGVMLALENYFKQRLPDELSGGSVNATVKLLSSKELEKNLTGNVLGIYLHRIMLDPHVRNRYLQPTGSEPAAPQPELPVNLHFLLIGVGNSAVIEMDLIAWGMQQLSNAVQFDVSHVQMVDEIWGHEESVKVIAEEISTEDIYRIWDVFGSKYTISIPYVVKTIRLLPEPLQQPEELTRTRVFPVGEYEH